jgi:hypothetical protein
LQQQGYRTALVGKYLNNFGLYAPPGYRPPGWDEFLAFTTDGTSPGDYYDYTLSDGSVHGSTPDDYSTDVLAAAPTDVVRTSSRRPAALPLVRALRARTARTGRAPAPARGGSPQAKPGRGRLDQAAAGVQALDPPQAGTVARTARRQQQALMAVDEAVAAWSLRWPTPAGSRTP